MQAFISQIDGQKPVSIEMNGSYNTLSEDASVNAAASAAG